MARPARPERSRSARSSRQLSRFYHSINPDRVFGTHSVQIRDGLIAIYYGRKARVRILDERSTITLKGEHKGLGRSEFEYAIPFPDAEEMLRTMCDGRVLEKIRYYVPHAELTWEINVYDGILKGVGCGRTSLDTTIPLTGLPNTRHEHGAGAGSRVMPTNHRLLLGVLQSSNNVRALLGVGNADEGL